MKNDFSDSVDNRFVQIILFYLLYFFACCIKSKQSEEWQGSVSSEEIASRHAVYLSSIHVVDESNTLDGGCQPGVV